MHELNYGEAPTVKQLIQILKKLPQDQKCFVRPKYNGTLSWTDDCPINANGVCGDMENKKLGKHVCFLI